MRPAVIESALADPFPGWNQGVNTSAPLTYLSGRGYRFYPASAELVLDIIPVDLAAHAMIPILAALLTKRHRPVYQLCTSDVNPLPMRRLVELTALSNRREHRKEGGAMAKIGPHIEAVVVSQNTYDLASDTMPRVMKYAASFARSVLGEESERARKFESTVDWIAEDMDLARDMVEVYRPYIQELIYTFHGVNIRELYAALKPADAARHPFRPDRSIGPTTGSMCICPGCDATSFRSSICTRRAAPICSSAIARWSRCWKTRPIATARASR